MSEASLDVGDSLKMTQSVIDRMARESANLKGWVIALVCGLLAVSRLSGDGRLLLVTFIPTLLAYVLDSYYLGSERWFREIYRSQLPRGGDAPAQASIIVELDSPGPARWRTFGRFVRDGATSPILVVFYGGLILSITIAIVLLWNVTPGSISPGSPARPTAQDALGREYGN